VEQAIEVRGLVREFKGGIHAVAGIDLDVAPGEKGPAKDEVGTSPA